MEKLFLINKLKLTDEVLINSLLFKTLPKKIYYDTQNIWGKFLHLNTRSTLILFKFYSLVYLIKLVNDYKNKKNIREIILHYLKNVLRSTTFMFFYWGFYFFAINNIKKNNYYNLFKFYSFNVLSISSCYIEGGSRLNDLFVFILPHFIRSLYKFLKNNLFENDTIYFIQNYIYIISVGLFTSFILQNDKNVKRKEGLIFKFIDYFFQKI